LVLKSWWL